MLCWIGGNLEGRFRLSETLDFGALRNFGVLCWIGGNLASMHMRNLECAIVVLAKLRGVFVETSGCVFVVWVWCVRWLPFFPFQCVQPFQHSCILGTFVGVKELKGAHYLRYVYIFRFGVGVLVV